MSHYSKLLKLAVAELVSVVKNKGQQSLLSGRNGVLISDKKTNQLTSGFSVNNVADYSLNQFGGLALPDCQAKPDLLYYLMRILCDFYWLKMMKYLAMVWSQV